MNKFLYFVVVSILSVNLSATMFIKQAVSSDGFEYSKQKEILYSYDFEESVQGWTILGTELGWNWGNSTTLSSHYFSFDGNDTNFLAINSEKAGDGFHVVDTAISPVMDLEQYAGRNLDFNFKYLFSSTYGGIATVNYRMSPEEDWQLLEAIEASSWNTSHISLPQNLLQDGVQFGFFYDDEEAWAEGFAVDDVSIVLADDTEAPEFISLRGNLERIGSSMDLVLTVDDPSGVPPVIEATYNLSGVEENIIMNLSSDSEGYCYTAAIASPVQESSCDITFHLEDLVEPANTADVVKRISFVEPLVVDTLFEDFESITDFSVDPLPYYFQDLDGDETHFWADIDFENEGYTGSFIIFKPTATTPPQIYNGILPNSGEKFIGCIASVGDKKNNDWLISPQISIANNYTLEFWAKSLSNNYGLERFRVGISTTGINTNDFTIISDSLNTAGKDYVEAPTEWKKYSFDLSNYGGEDYIHFAINCISEDALMFMVDDIIVKSFVIDTDAPVAGNLTGGSVIYGQDMNLTLAVSDTTGVASVVGMAAIDGDEIEIPMTPVGKFIKLVREGEKELFLYEGVIEAQFIPMEGTIVFEMTDSSDSSNTGFSDPYPIAWESLDNVVLVEGFEDEIFPPEEWSSNDNDGDGYNWSLSSDFTIHSGAQIATSASNINEVGELTPDNWLISPKIIEPVSISYWVSAQDDDWAGEHYGIFVSTSTTALSDFEEVFSETMTAKTAGSWYARTIDLSDYSSENVYIAFRHFDCTDMFWLNLDDVIIKGSSLDIEEIKIPVTTELYQNYPNPFNPSTTINFFNSVSGKVKLSVFNVKGELVATLVNGRMSVSQHSVNFNASNLNSGVYYYTLETPAKSITKKMILIK